MPKLNSSQQKAAETANTEGFAPLPGGRYVGQLVAVTTGEGNKGPYWNWEYGIVAPEEYKGRKVWNVTSLSAAAAFKVRESYDAFGYTLDSDTDEMIGEQVTLLISQRTIQAGKRAGEIGNQIDRVASLDGDATDSDTDAEF